MDGVLRYRQSLVSFPSIDRCLIGLDKTVKQRELNFVRAPPNSFLKETLIHLHPYLHSLLKDYYR